MDFNTIKKEVMIKLQDPDPDIIHRIPNFINEIVDKAIETVEPPEFKIIGSVTTASRQLAFSGGSSAISVGDIITGGTSGAYATVTSVTIDSGSWAGGDAVGTLGITTQIDTFESETITSDGGGTATISSDSTDAAYYVSMPSGYSGKLLFVGTKERDIKQMELEELVELYPDMDSEGEVTRCAVEGSTFYYQGVPTTAETIPLVYRRNPTQMSANSDEPDGIPAMLHRDIIVCGAAMLGWDLIEDGIEEGQRVNTRAQEYHYNKGIDRFHGWVRKRTDNQCKGSWRY